MQLKETNISWPVELEIATGEFGTVLDLVGMHGACRIALCRQQAQLLLPILEHFIKAGRLPDAS